MRSLQRASHLMRGDFALVRRRIAFFLSVSAFVVGCGSGSSNQGDCPSMTVDTDAASEALPADGGYATGAVCSQFCPSGYEVCRSANPGQIVCMKGCS